MSCRKNLILNTVSIDLGCNSCRRPKLYDIFHLKSSARKNRNQNGSNCSDTATESRTTSPTKMKSVYYSESETWKVKGFGRIGSESVAVEKDSDDPYLDFRQSMLQMILENEIYSKDELRDLLNCFLQLNSSFHHGIIVRAFTEIWNGVFSLKS